MRRGRRDPVQLAPGDALDFWRVEQYEEDRLLRLFAEMKTPGRAWLQFEVEPKDEGSLIRQTAIFEPKGLWGLVYWYALYPLHGVIFGGMLREIVSGLMQTPYNVYGAEAYVALPPIWPQLPTSACRSAPVWKKALRRQRLS